MNKKNTISLKKKLVALFSAVLVCLLFSVPSYAAVGDPDLPGNQIGTELYEEALSHGVKGQIWITKDGNTLHYINHGHAGLLYAYAPYYRCFIEHRGTSNPLEFVSTYSQMYVWDWGEGDTWWSTVHTLRTYNVQTPQGKAEGLPYDLGTMISAADYAEKYLIGKSYAPLALKTADSINCATLIYKAYLNADKYDGNAISLGNPKSTTVIPKDLVEDENLIPAFNAQWGGDQHTW